MCKNLWVKFTIVLVLGSLVIAGCSPAQATPSAQPTSGPNPMQEPTQAKVAPVEEPISTPGAKVVLSEQDAGKTIHLLKGERLVVTLEGNPTTGYTWEMAQTDEIVLSIAGEPEFKADSNLIGAGGKISLVFKAEFDGQQDLKLVYHRPWEKDVPPEKTFEVTVVVGDKPGMPQPEPQPTATPSTVIYPSNGMKGWLTYTNDNYGFTFQYPPDWKIIPATGTMSGHAVWLTPGSTDNVLLQVAFKQASDDAQIGRTGVGSGELVKQGKVLLEGKEIDRQVLVSDGKHMTVMYTCPDCMQRGDLVFTFDLDYRGNWSDASALPVDVETQADLIVASLKIE